MNIIHEQLDLLLVRSKYKGTLKKLQLKQFYGGCLPLSMTTNIQKVWGPWMGTEAVVLPKLLVQCSGDLIEMHCHKIAFFAISSR